jgi:hypothetical protein
MTCRDCQQAQVQTWWGGYSIGCAGCSARAVARSLDAFNALSPQGTGDKEALRYLITRAMPNIDIAQARRMVWEWWLRDHPQQADRPSTT